MPLTFDLSYLYFSYIPPSFVQHPIIGGFWSMVLIFKTSRLCIEPLTPDVIHGELRKRTRFVLSGADLLARAKNAHKFGMENP